MQVSTAVVPRRFRRRLLERACAKWLVPELRCIALPDADRRKRFFVPLCVFILLFLAFPLAIVAPLEFSVNHCIDSVCERGKDSRADQTWKVLMNPGCGSIRALASKHHDPPKEGVFGPAARTTMGSILFPRLFLENIVPKDSSRTSELRRCIPTVIPSHTYSWLG